MRKRALISMITAAIVLSGTTALAFPFLKSWHDRADGSQSNGGRAGAGGIYGMGGATDYSITCAHCHIGGQGTIGVTITPTPAFTKVNGQDTYKPGQMYSVNVVLTGEHRGLGQGNNNLNGMAATFENQSGKVAGVLTSDAGASSANCPATFPAQNPAGKTTYTYGDCHGIVYVPVPNATSWTFSWTAPAKGAGQVTMFYGVVDGDSDGKSSLDDDVKMGTMKLGEGN